jgi:GNAT superfamily N-acetyltransferase
VTAPGEVVLRLLRGEPGEMRELQRVLEEAPEYFRKVTGLPPGRAEAQSTFTALPEGKAYDDKFVFGIYRAGGMVGCADLIRGHPDPSTAFLGLLLVSESSQGQGVGRRAYELLETFVRCWGTCQRIRLGVVRTNDGVLPFWTGRGFRPTGEVRPYRCGSVVSETILLEKPLEGEGPE